MKECLYGVNSYSLKDLCRMWGQLALGSRARDSHGLMAMNVFFFIRERIDRVVANKKWLWKFEDAKVIHLCAEFSDHTPILWQTHMPISNVRHQFRFFKAWMGDPSSMQVVENAWHQYVKSGYGKPSDLQKIATHLKSSV